MVGAVQAQTPMVIYDEVLDQITIKATDTALKSLAEELSKATGIDARVDSAIVDVKISIHIESQPLEQGLQRGFRGYNHAIKYRTRGDHHLVTSILILPTYGAATNTSHDRASSVGMEYFNDNGEVPEIAQDAVLAKGSSPKRRIRYLDDLTPWEQSQLTEEERHALPIRPPAKSVPVKLPSRCTKCARDDVATDREGDTDG